MCAALRADVLGLCARARRASLPWRASRPLLHTPRAQCRMSFVSAARGPSEASRLCGGVAAPFLRPCVRLRARALLAWGRVVPDCDYFDIGGWLLQCSDVQRLTPGVLRHMGLLQVMLRVGRNSGLGLWRIAVAFCSSPRRLACREQARGDESDGQRLGILRRRKGSILPAPQSKSHRALTERLRQKRFGTR